MKERLIWEIVYVACWLELKGQGNSDNPLDKQVFHGPFEV